MNTPKIRILARKHRASSAFLARLVRKRGSPRTRCLIERNQKAPATCWQYSGGPSRKPISILTGTSFHCMPSHGRQWAQPFDDSTLSPGGLNVIPPRVYLVSPSGNGRADRGTVLHAETNRTGG